MSNKSTQHDVSAPVESSASEAFMDSVRAGAASVQPRGATDGEVVLEALRRQRVLRRQPMRA